MLIDLNPIVINFSSKMQSLSKGADHNLFKMASLYVEFDQKCSLWLLVFGCIVTTNHATVKLMRLESANRIDDFESKTRSEFDRRLPSIRIPTIFDQINDRDFDTKSIYF